ncbi:aminotransferase class I/II-fold pyridoxal phosphate-dependent enzyme [Rudanella paleaurantiibacter]|uniref:Aminotransferase class I/II-fold pyridoxal phosphate-dependent enzyme n=1 Tax=Rudanella paleaurantiibacter TaxID=2614655 RepID=A0A7J5TXM5_9BACT|nr:8-amino-7-oxononanoate synthase [Rudanella paleaurantiibacter]KAB7729321.1 aminotransferase class I/II-fold pyridoxal phosphate-dependent enzyme [Rudanella paleaurantiibacter]
MHDKLAFLDARLQQRQQAGLLRTLRPNSGLIDFCSNDYLGLARSATLREAIREAERQSPDLANGATGSRLLAGHTLLADAVEAQLAAYYQTETALVFNAGYDANIGLLSALPGRDDVLLTDELIHASMIDGARLSYATRHRFRHNDLTHLDELLRQARARTQVGQQVFVAVESVYSMDGDLAPLPQLVQLCEQYEAHLIVDEAHATGVYGSTGAGRVAELGLSGRVLARVHTFGKGLGVHGAAVVGPRLLRDYLINTARSFIYTTALPPHSLLAIGCAHEQVSGATAERQYLHRLIELFRQQAAQKLPHARWTDSPSPIQCLLIGGNEACRSVATRAQQAGFDVRAILSPTVPVGQERLRICLHSFNTEAQITHLLDSLTIG